MQPVSARYLPLGAYSKSYADIYATRSNAASLARLPYASLALYAERRFLLASLQAFQCSGSLTTRNGAFALHGSYMGIRLFSQSQFSLAYGMRLSKKVDAGLQLNYHSLRQGGGYGNTYSINASAGAIFHLTDEVHAGINIYNPLGSKWNKAGGEKIPAQFTLGLGYEVSENLYLSTEIIKEENLPAAVNSGLQYRFSKLFFVRAGISTATASYFAGVGLQFKTFRTDIAVSYHSPLGISPGILFLFPLGKQKETPAGDQQPDIQTSYNRTPYVLTKTGFDPADGFCPMECSCTTGAINREHYRTATGKPYRSY